MSKRYEDIYTQNYYDQYSVGNGHEGYEDSKYTKDFLKNIAGRIYEDRKPESVLDVGCAMGYLVEALRDLGGLRRRCFRVRNFQGERGFKAVL